MNCFIFVSTRPLASCCRSAMAVVLSLAALATFTTPAQADDVTIDLGNFFLQPDLPFPLDISQAVPPGRYTSWTLTTDYSRVVNPNFPTQPNLLAREFDAANPQLARVQFTGPGIAFNNRRRADNLPDDSALYAPIDGLQWSSIFNGQPILTFESYNPFTNQFLPRVFGEAPGVNFDGNNEFTLTLEHNFEFVVGSSTEDQETTLWANTVLTLNDDPRPGFSSNLIFELNDAGDLGPLTDNVSDTASANNPLYHTFTHLGGFLELDTFGSQLAFSPQNTATRLFLFDEAGNLVAEDLNYSAGDGLSKITLLDLPAGNYATVSSFGRDARSHDALFGVFGTGDPSLTGNIRLNLTVPEPASATLLLAATATLLCRRRVVA